MTLQREIAMVGIVHLRHGKVVNLLCAKENFTQIGNHVTKIVGDHLFTIIYRSASNVVAR